MKQNSKLALTLHCLGHMAVQPDQWMTSDQIALHNHTNAVVVRRVLGALRDKGLVRSTKGHAGGWQLARAADQITVADVYTAIDEPFLTRTPMSTNPGCAIVAAMTGIVGQAMTEAEAVLRQHFARCTMADLAAAMTQKPPSHSPISPL